MTPRSARTTRSRSPGGMATARPVTSTWGRRAGPAWISTVTSTSQDDPRSARRVSTGFEAPSRRPNVSAEHVPIMNRFFRKQGPEPTSVEEQRSFQRIRVVLNVLCRQQGDDVPIFTDDVSESGLRFVSQQALQID